MTIIISDIDGTLCTSIFTNDGSQDQFDPSFHQALLDLPLLPWVIEKGLKAFQNARCVIFVTGRGIHLNCITATWILDKLGIHSFRMVNCTFTNYSQHVRDKKAYLQETIDQCIKARIRRYEPIHVLEDDPAVLEYLVDIAPGYDGIIIHSIQEGKHSITYPRGVKR